MQDSILCTSSFDGAQEDEGVCDMRVRSFDGAQDDEIWGLDKKKKHPKGCFRLLIKLSPKGGSFLFYRHAKTKDFPPEHDGIDQYRRAGSR